MTVLIATDAGVRLVVDVAIDCNTDRLVAINRHIGAPTSWTTNTGVITALKDGAESLVVEVEVSGAFSGSVELLAPGGQVIAASKAIDVAINNKAVVVFRVSRNHEKDMALAGS